MAIHLNEHFNYKKLLKSVLPTMLMMIFTSIYSIVDGIFVSNCVGNSAFAGLNLFFPVLMIIGAIGFMLGAGGSALASMKLGQKDNENANKVFTMIIYFTIILGFIISIIVFIFIEPLTIALGSVGGVVASQEMIDNAMIYGRILICFEVVFMLENVFQSFFVVAEKATLGFFVVLIAGITNMLLDALFMAVFDFGIAGAAFATGISQTIGAIIPIVYFSKKNKSLLLLTKTNLDFKILLKSSINGSSELLTNIAMNFVSIIFNLQLLKYIGENGVSAYGIIMYVSFVFCAIFIGYTIGIAPIVGYNYGAKNYNELRNVLNKSLILIGIFNIVMVILMEALAGVFSVIFAHGNQELIDITVRGCRLYGLCFLFTGFNIFASSFFTGLNNGLVSAIISFVRTLILETTCVIVLPLLLGLDGIWLSMVLAEFLSVTVVAICFLSTAKKYKLFAKYSENV